MSGRHVLSFPIEGRRFNYRVAAVIVVDGHVLVCREDDDDYVMLPGGRVELGEASTLSLAREIAEELALPAEIGPLAATSESFYRRDGEEFHELAIFYRVALPGQRPDGSMPWLVRHDEGHELQFSWVPLEGGGLEAVNLLPAWLPVFLRRHAGPAVDAVPHVVHDARAP